MSRIKELRVSIDKKLDALEHQALALESQLAQTKEQALQRLEQRKQQLRELLQQVQTEIQQSKELAAQVKTEVQAKLEHLQVQLALGKAEAREALEEHRTKILKALSEFESIVDEKLKGADFESGKLWENLVDRASILEAEFEALKNRFESEKAKQEAQLEEKKQARSWPSYRPSKTSSRRNAGWSRTKPMPWKATCGKGWSRSSGRCGAYSSEKGGDKEMGGRWQRGKEKGSGIFSCDDPDRREAAAVSVRGTA